MESPAYELMRSRTDSINCPEGSALTETADAGTHKKALEFLMGDIRKVARELNEELGLQ